MIGPNRVVITGMGVIAPDANNLAEFDSLLREGRSAIHFVPELKEHNFECQIGGIADARLGKGNRHTQYFEIDQMNDYIRLTVKAGLEAWADAGLELPEPDCEEVDYNTGVVIGGILPGMELIGRRLVPLVDSLKVRRLGSMVIENTMPSGASAYISALFAAGNHSISLNSACSTGTDSILSGVNSIYSGYVKRMIVGASESYSHYTWAGFDALRVLNRECNDRPENGSSPLSEKAHGFVPGSGSAVLVLEELETALARGARIYAEVLGGSVSCGAMRSGGSITFPNKYGVVRCLRNAMMYSGITAEDIDYINGHLSGTVADVLEVDNWVEALDERTRPFPYINSTKSLVGHCLGAAGAIEVVATILQLKHGYVHASLNTEVLHPEIEQAIGRNAVPLQTIEAPDLKIAAKASFGFGDVNSAIIFKKWE
jgi:3-oxoacyl-(acyl-carrier-protein) synthase